MLQHQQALPYHVLATFNQNASGYLRQEKAMRCKESSDGDSPISYRSPSPKRPPNPTPINDNPSPTIKDKAPSLSWPDLNKKRFPQKPKIRRRTPQK